MILLIRYLLIALYLCLEFLRIGKQAKSLKPQETDRNSTLLIGCVIVIAIILSPLLGAHSIGTIQSSIVIWIGITIAIIGIVIRYWAMQTLGERYTRTLITTDSHKLITIGPYSIIRHPGYTGSILFWIGIGLSWQNYLVTLIIFFLISIAYTYRMITEEKMLNEAFGEKYSEYMKRTKRLIPFVY